MKRSLLALVFAFVLSGVSFAHPPSDIKAEFSILSHDLTATIVHPVDNPSEHYISAIEVTLNNQPVIQDTLDRQDSETSIMVIYNIPTAGLGDVIEIKAHCNKGGELAKKITVQ